MHARWDKPGAWDYEVQSAKDVGWDKRSAGPP